VVQTESVSTADDLGRLIAAAPPHIDPEILQQLRTLHSGGAAVSVASRIADLPLDLRRLYESGAVTIEQLAILHHDLGITAMADLAAAVRRGDIRRLPGLDSAVETAIVRVLPHLRSDATRVPLGRALAITEPILTQLRAMPGVDWAEPVGSLRRRQDMVGDIEIVAPTVDPGRVFDQLAATTRIARSLLRNSRRFYFLLDGVQIGVRCPPPHRGGAALINLTGNPKHVARLADLATARGWSLDPHGLHKNDGTAAVAGSEEAIYAALGLPFIAPELREAAGEIEAATAGTLPGLVTIADIRGDLHMHSNWSDGRDSIEVMVTTAAALGYDYVAITDHSEHSAASRSLLRDDVARQAEAIAGVREQYPHIVVLHGCEVDILPNGTLDFPDAILQRFDIVLASLHDRAGHSPDKLQRRYARAMQHPLVNIITHPANRHVPHRSGYPLNWDQVFAEAFETGTVLEIDGAPSHLDMDGALARRAVASGVLVSIDSDCHRADLLGRQMQMGLGMARRGWVEPRHVINTRPIAEIRALIAAKRSR
jgi:DNA polymerase (family 10)